MTQQVFAVYDSKAERYLPPFTTTTSGVAERIFTDMVNTPKHQFNTHPEDYTLYRIGVFDDATAEILPEAMAVVCTALQVWTNAHEGNLSLLQEAN